MNAALRRLLAELGGGQPLPTSQDLYRELQAVTPDSLRYLLTDLFARNTYWELEAQAEPAGSGTWRVTLDARARKVAVDSAGVVTEIPMNDLIEVGFFAEGEAPIYSRPHRLRSAEQTITQTMPGKPVRAGIDPNHLLIDPETDDKLTEIEND